MKNDRGVFVLMADEGILKFVLVHPFLIQFDFFFSFFALFFCFFFFAWDFQFETFMSNTWISAS